MKPDPLTHYSDQLKIALFPALVNALQSYMHSAPHGKTCCCSLCMEARKTAALIPAHLQPYHCILCGQRIDDGKPCGCGARKE